ncbi:MAG TPA: glycosyltransferase, partial [Candidatus Binatus sp.]|nr:glycosyltransferase [Candidatus Binatus sp.]
IDAIRLSIAARSAGDPEIIHLVGTNALLFSPASKLLGSKGRIIRHIFTPFDAKDRAIAPVRRFANRFFIDSYAFTTPRIGQWAKELSPRTKHYLIRPPINCAYYKPNPTIQSRTSESSDGFQTILYMGPLLQTRFPYEMVLRALKRLVGRGMKLRLIVLTSPSRTSKELCDRVLSLARDLSIQEYLHLERIDLNEDERIERYNQADTVIFPYVGPEPERLADPPFGILEAMACGAIVLSTDVLSVSEVLRDGVNGFLIKKASVDDLASGLLGALGASEDTHLRMKARERIVEGFDYPIVAKEMIKSYDNLLDR